MGHKPSRGASAPKSSPKRKQNPTTKRQVRRDKRKEAAKTILVAKSIPETPWEWFVHSIEMTFRSNLDKGYTLDHAAAEAVRWLGRTPETMKEYWRKIQKARATGEDVISSVRYIPEEGFKQKYVHEYMDSLFTDGKMIHSPTLPELVAGANDIARKYGDTVSESTCQRVLDQESWTPKRPSKVSRKDHPETMQKRVDYCKAFIELAHNLGVYVVFGDETSFEAAEDSPHRLSPAGTPAVHSNALATPSRSPGLGMVFYMSRDGIISWGISYETTESGRFFDNFVKALIAAHKKAPTHLRIIFIIDNAPYHSEKALKIAINLAMKITDAPAWRFSFQYTSPHSPDLNLVEYFNHHIKASLRHHLKIARDGVFIVKAYVRPPGRKPAQLKKYHEKLVTTDYRMSPSNVSMLADQLLHQSVADSTPGCWDATFAHILRWCHALIKYDGQYDKASVEVAALGPVTHDELPWNTERTQTRRSATLLETPLKRITPLRLTDDQLEYCAIESFHMSDSDGDLDYDPDAPLEESTDEDPCDDAPFSGPLSVETRHTTNKKKGALKYDLPDIAAALNDGSTKKKIAYHPIAALPDESDLSDLEELPTTTPTTPKTTRSSKGKQ